MKPGTPPRLRSISALLIKAPRIITVYLFYLLWPLVRPGGEGREDCADVGEAGFGGAWTGSEGGGREHSSSNARLPFLLSIKLLDF